MHKSPPIPPEQRAFGDKTADTSVPKPDRRDTKTGLQSSQPGDDDVNLDEQGRQANMRQNLRPHRSVRDR